MVAAVYCGPLPAPTHPSEEATIAKPKSTSQAELDAHNGMELDPLIDALLEHLPAPGDVFLPASRKLWMQIFELALQLIYLEKEPEPEPEHGGQA